MPDVDLTGYYRLLETVCPPRAKPTRAPKPERPTMSLVHRPTLDRTQVRGRVLAMIVKADQPQQ